MLLAIAILSFTSNLTHNFSKSLTNSYYFSAALKSFIKFRKSHPSPNGGILESITAGALRIKLGGLNFYGGIESKRPVIGFEDYGVPSSKNIMDVINIMELASVLLVFFYLSVIAAVGLRIRY